MASFFHGNPFSSPVGQRIERATDGGLSSEDWTLNIEICDIINETDEGPKDAIKAIRKRLTVTNKNYKSVLLTLTVLETCVKNCGHRFHSLIARKDFLDELTKIINPKNTPPQIVQDKILGLIQNWSDAFRESSDLVAVVHTYDALKAQGFEFPAQDLDTLAPIYTPQRSVPESESRPATAPVQRPIPAQQLAAAPVAVMAQPPAMVQRTGPIHPTPEQLAKLRSQLDIVQGNVTVMSEMLTEMTPGQEESGDLELLQELNRTCRAMQSRLLELLEKVANEEVIGELLRINDDLNNVFIRYDRYERFRQASQPQSQQATPAPAAATVPVEPPRPVLTATPISPPRPAAPVTSPPAAAPPSVTPAADSLISFDEESQSAQPVADTPTLQRTQAQPQMAAPAQDDEFDMFAQSRSSNMEESRKAGSSYSDNLQPFDRTISSAMSVTSDRADGPPKPAAQENQAPRQTSAQTGNQQGVAIESIESWLGETNLNDTPVPAGGAAAPSAKETMSSSEFDDFLAERAAAGGQRTGSVKGNSRPRQRQMQMADTKAEEELFGL